MTTEENNIFEYYLFLKREKQVKRLLPKKFESILDFGCGQIPLFLIKITAEIKIGFDKNDKGKYILKVINKHYKEIEEIKNFSFEVMTAMAVIEHLINPKYLFNFAYTMLKKNGILIITTPVPWSHFILKILAWLKILSWKQINEHKHYYTQKKLRTLLIKAGFENIKSGFFELGMNQWFYAEKNNCDFLEKN